MKITLDKITLGVVALLGFITIGMVSFLLFEKAPVTFANIPFPVDKAEYKTGETVISTIRECSDETIRYTYTQSFLNIETGVSYLVGSITHTTEAGCHTIKAAPAVVTPSLEDGTYILYYQIIAKSKFRSLTYDTAESRSFEIEQVLPEPEEDE